MATNSVGCVCGPNHTRCIVQNSIYHSAHADAEEDESNLIHIKALPLVHVPTAVSEIALSSACCLKKFSKRFKKDFCFNISDGWSVWEMPSLQYLSGRSSQSEKTHCFQKFTHSAAVHTSIS